MPIVASSADRVRAGDAAAVTTWQQAMKTAIRDPKELCRRLKLPPEVEPIARRAAGQFGLFVPLSYLDRIEPGQLDDPLLRQVLPLDEELLDTPGFTADPVGDLPASPLDGLVHKYRGRVLLIVSGRCAVHCRYCFRRHFPYVASPKSLQAWQPALRYVAEDPQIEEVIFSGGDPLTRSDAQLAALAVALASIPHLRRLRVHTRLPIVIPQRVTDDLIDWLCGTRLSPVFVVHTNHPRELNSAVTAALVRLVDAGMIVLNQSVLLRGVNDSADVLVQLCRRLSEIGIRPYN